MTGGRLVATSFVLAFLLVRPGTAEAQFEMPPTWIQGGLGLSQPYGDFGDFADGGVGWTAQVTVAYRPSLELSLSYLHDNFRCTTNEEFACGGTDGDWIANGFRLAVLYRLPETLGLQPWARGGVLFHRLSFRSDQVDEFDSDWSFGPEGGAGIEAPVSPQISISVGARTSWFGVDIPDGPPVDVTAWVAEMVIRFRVN